MKLSQVDNIGLTAKFKITLSVVIAVLCNTVLIAYRPLNGEYFQDFIMIYIACLIAYFLLIGLMRIFKKPPPASPKQIIARKWGISEYEVDEVFTKRIKNHENNR
jgi:hypothetical protein